MRAYGWLVAVVVAAAVAAVTAVAMMPPDGQVIDPAPAAATDYFTPDELDDAEEEADGEESSAGEEGSDSAQPRAAGRNWADEPATDYMAFTTRFDEIVEAEELCDVDELGRRLVG